MTYYLFASHGVDTYIVEAESEVEAKGVMYDTDTTETMEFVGSVDEYLDGESVKNVKP